MKAKWTIALLTALFVGGAATAVAGEKADMATLDADGDGQISAEEAKAHPELAERFETLDENQDQVLDQAEFARFETEMKETEEKATEE